MNMRSSCMIDILRLGLSIEDRVELIERWIGELTILGGSCHSSMRRVDRSDLVDS